MGNSLIAVLCLVSCSLFAQIPGAVGDGATDDSAAIQAALDAHSEVVFEQKTYRVATGLTFHTGQKIVGKGIGSTVLLGDEGVNILSTTGNFTSIRDITIRGGGPAHLAGAGINLGTHGTATGNTCSIENAEVLFCSSGLHNDFYDGVTARNCVLHGNTVNIRCEENVAAMSISDCIVNDATGNGIEVANGGTLIMRGGNLNSNGMSGIGAAVFLDSSGTKFKGDGIQFEGVANWTAGAAYVSGGHNVTITLVDCQFQDGGNFFKHVTSANTSHVTVDRCAVYNAPSGGPWLYGYYSFDARSNDQSLLVSYNEVYTFRASPWRTYSYGDALPIASVTSEPIYSVATWNGSIGTSDLHTFFKQQMNGSFSYRLGN